MSNLSLTTQFQEVLAPELVFSNVSIANAEELYNFVVESLRECHNLSQDLAQVCLDNGISPDAALKEVDWQVLYKKLTCT